jgi:predicted nuclease of predicted toxin-antitoxin system
MRLLANENIPLIVIEALRERGHDVLWIRTESPGAPDRDVLAKADTQSRLLLTFDKDFGELAFRQGLPARSGIILIRLTQLHPDEMAKVIADIIESRDDWPGHFSVIEPQRIRMVPLS